MTSSPSTIEPSKSVADAARIMKQEDAGVVPVTANGRLTGMVTDRDRAIRVVDNRGDGTKTGQVVQEISE
jgi:CBS domain-containing protein